MGQDLLLQVGGHEEAPGLLSRHIAIVVLVDALEIPVILALQLRSHHPLPIRGRGTLQGEKEVAEDLLVLLWIVQAMC